MNNDLKTYHCTILDEEVQGRVCEARRMKANITLYNPFFIHGLKGIQLRECGKCKKEPRGLTTLRKAAV